MSEMARAQHCDKVLARIPARLGDVSMSFTLPPLPFAAGALAAHGMSQETMELHHDKHHNAYVTALNGLV
jgi:hypothetical protein